MKANCASSCYCQTFLPRLQEHLIGRLTGRTFDGEEESYAAHERSRLVITNNSIYLHKTVRVNYTTYDMRRDQDSINPRTHPDVMVLSRDDPHPYWYARVLAIFHVYALYTGEGARYAEPQKFDVLWIRWFGRDVSASGGFDTRRLHLIGFVESSDKDAFGFLDPDQVIRATHLIPAFMHGRTTEALGPSAIRHTSEDDMDWRFYYVNQ